MKGTEKPVRIIKSIIVSFSMYSRIPMPIFTWDDRDLKHAISALPLIGAVIGALSFAVYKLLVIANAPEFSMVLLLSVLPLIITGGFHVDGFMDVQDALNSYQDRQKKLEIMKDPHIGAFAIISLAMYGMIWLSFFYMLLSKAIEEGNYRFLYIYMTSFFLVRALCGLTCVVFPKAKKEGMLSSETGNTGSIDKIILSVFIIAGVGAILFFDFYLGLACTLALLAFTFYYKYRCDKEFGGVTGDTAGYYVCMGELLMVICLSIMNMMI